MATQPVLRWLASITWESIAEMNRAQCQEKGLAPAPNRGHDKARQLWIASHHLEMSLFDAIDLCRRCNDCLPFSFNCGNTFAVIGGKLVKSWVAALPSLEARMVDLGVKHFINGKIRHRELRSTLNHAAKTAAPPAPAAPTPKAAAAPPLPAAAPKPSVTVNC